MVIALVAIISASEIVVLFKETTKMPQAFGGWGPVIVLSMEGNTRLVPCPSYLIEHTKEVVYEPIPTPRENFLISSFDSPASAPLFTRPLALEFLSGQ